MTNRFSDAISELQSCSPLLQKEDLTEEEKTSRVILIYTMVEALCELGVEIDADELKQIVGGLE